MQKNTNTSINTNNYANYLGKTLFEWEIDELKIRERTKRWYIVAISFALLMLLFSFMTANFLFAVIIIITSLIIVLTDGKSGEKININITSIGVGVGKGFYEYDELKDFSIVYKPHLNVKNLYFEFKNVLRPRLSISLENMDPLTIRESLLKYLPEDLERTNRPLSEELASLFRL
ncbi:hypothetical protein A2331_03225 [Candidatus Falkowbacteria bacterium RIFOXYB2_FULL_34_18]|uniref:DUF5673 domain-containing protein n=1 Tax=Candidatus Falkowbacteria bacterium RIFOXYD2_FULL_34_120 TaxID=1798007 RepID=A0A1F5TNV5_9BACT|nr:MAG: hypothetical protein A2500_02540 [Candidatus Falkowbacteria bacterium RIFOXYC12_FULL_34_55]OGF28589.1 MAG: hypothetical protein A2331_03225 [Candidatus Falkowbacteria bacterium RIFOXYB2_FULL_34_18]OGF38030.1 MAG: hypothetical protein A2466_06940 [Candidatus Falkowbacteria bacterium RIFOXYC2_FULL_34_220]OGF38279.1 MAG: hypothetical protein A2515_04975 [Candidatus Falkowbacteria bacterium RIFOXYD12_FULL_34_57]OGF40191.1 MAG: hypothetical protein A2531_01170 [Candidatus Falkowbacteria bact